MTTPDESGSIGGFDPRRWVADRIYYGWVIAVACLLASMAVYGASYAFGVFYDSFLETFDASRSTIAAAFGLQTFVLYVAGVGAGRLVDEYGQRLVALGGGILMTLGLVISAYARTFSELLVGFGLVTATGMAALYVVGYATVPLWFERRRGTAAGFAAAGLGVGLVVVPPGADRLIAAFGWRPAMLAVAAGTGLLTLVIVALFADDPGDVGAERSLEFDTGGVGHSPPSAGSDAGSTTTVSHPTSATSIMRSVPFLLVFVGWVLVFTPLYVILSHVVLHASDLGVGRAIGVAAITAIGVATTVARLGIGILSDRAGRVATFVVCAVIMGVATAGFAFTPDERAFLAVAVIFGIGYGGCGGLLGPLIADLFGNVDLTTLYAVASISFAISGLAAPPASGFLFELLGSYTVAMIGAGVSGLLGAGCVFLADRLVTHHG